MKNEVEIDNPLLGTKTVLTVPEAGLTHVLFPLESGGFYRPEAHAGDKLELFILAFVETMLTEPGKAGSGEWTLSVK